MALTPTCPECGSIRSERVEWSAKRWRCLEPDCGHEAEKIAFLSGGPKVGWTARPNTAWRDSAALSMDGYDE